MYSKPICISDFEKHARAFLPKNALDYYLSGANEEVTLRESNNAFKRYVVYRMAYFSVHKQLHNLE